MAEGHTDEVMGAQWYWDATTRLFWSWDTPELISKKIDILAARGVRSVMAWSIGADTNDWSHLKAMQAGFQRVNLV
jgi:chitinase